MSDHYIGIDDEGYFHFDSVRVDDVALGGELLKNLKMDDKGRLLTRIGDQRAFVEAFDAPLVARHVHKIIDEVCEIDLPYNQTSQFSLQTLSIDEWDRIHGVHESGNAIVLSRQAQIEFFNFLDEFDDESITVGGRRFSTPEWLTPNLGAKNEKFWSHIYQTETPGWEKGHAAVALPSVLPQLKLPRSRVLVLGCGSGHDAALLAQGGHQVTAIDISPEAIKRAQLQYGQVQGLRFIEMDLFDIPKDWYGEFDLIFEHTCYCAITPDRRNELVELWHKCLSEKGQLLAVLFVMEKRLGPPYGGSEWEVRQRLKKRFEFLYWTRWRQSIEGRKGKELVLLAQARRSS